ncbi:DUF2089 domain-containing protein [Candidatus Formimonas warabiya]|uniref:DUF2089 domain-containing protein n=1 Tax=Formimonas warabiya TaxID=1761012 RepID=UPI001BE3D78F|nr:DUF2089 domain-containing protein [Candidatus Formimonas warabiya]
MCFRPSSVAKKEKCPSCGKEFTLMGGAIVQKKCPHCGTEIAVKADKNPVSDQPKE